MRSLRPAVGLVPVLFPLLFSGPAILDASFRTACAEVVISAVERTAETHARACNGSEYDDEITCLDADSVSTSGGDGLFIRNLRSESEVVTARCMAEAYQSTTIGPADLSGAGSVLGYANTFYPRGQNPSAISSCRSDVYVAFDVTAESEFRLFGGISRGYFDGDGGRAEASIVLTGPDEFRVEVNSSQAEPISFDIPGTIATGSYELTVTSNALLGSDVVFVPLDGGIGWAFTLDIEPTATPLDIASWSALKRTFGP